MDTFFGPRNEIERREVLDRWLVDPIEMGDIRVRYHCLSWHDEHGNLAAVRDIFVATDVVDPACVVLLSHSYVLPAHRRGGVAALVRTAPATIARHDLASRGLPEHTPILLTAEMEPLDPDAEDSRVRLLAYGRAGFSVVHPRALPYFQPDFRDVAALGVAAHHVPMAIVVRWLGHERATELPTAYAEAIVHHFRRIHGRAVGKGDLREASEHGLAALRHWGRDMVPLLRIPPHAEGLLNLEPMLRANMLPYYPPQYRGTLPEPVAERNRLITVTRTMGGPLRFPEIPGEALFAQLVTTVPGPRSEALRQRHGQWQDARTVHFYQDAKKSLGNYIVDVDGNTLLDVYGHIAAVALGYNHPDMVHAWKAGRFDWCGGWRPSLGVAVPPEWVDVVGTLMRFAPAGMAHVATMTSGSEAVENAIKTAFIAKARRNRGGAAASQEEVDACMLNAQASANRLQVISFTGAFHGRTHGALSATRSKAIHKLDIPAFDWPVVEFPANRYPVAAFATENAAAEARALDDVEALMRRAPERIAAVIVEPVQGEGGDRHASPAFFQGLRRLCTQYGASFIADEVQTGVGTTGRMWAHEAWGAEGAPDIMTFSKKMQLGGYYYRADLMPPEPLRVFNTWLGDPLRGAQAEVILEVVERDNLVAVAAEVGRRLVAGLEELVSRHQGVLSQARGAGTYAAVDVVDAPTRGRILAAALGNGLEIGGSGDSTIRFRPSLVFGPRHVGELLDRLEAAVRSA